MNMKKIRLGDYISLITDYHSGGSVLPKVNLDFFRKAYKVV